VPGSLEEVKKLPIFGKDTADTMTKQNLTVLLEALIEPGDVDAAFEVFLIFFVFLWNF